MTTEQNLEGRNVGLSDGLGAVLTGIVQRANDELRHMTNADLEQFWHFRWDASATVEWNTYQFTDLLELYRRQCRRWEEMHNGSVCVVERVRDKYLMPKIVDFARLISTSNASLTGVPDAVSGTSELKR